MIEVDKISRLEMAGPWHYPYLLLESYALATYFIAARTGFYRSVYWINAGCYLGYCLVTAERDFLFVGLALLIHVQLFSPSMRSRRLVVLGAAGGALAALLAALREGKEFSVSQALNQGSLPFVDTFMRDVVPAFYPYRNGGTYLDAVVGMLPGVHRQPLEGWLVDLYTPGAPVGYGFSLTAEAYVNFGPLGVPVVFLVLGLTLRWIVNRADRSDWWTYLSVVAVTAVFNGVRGESGQLVRIVLYGSAFYGVLWLVSSRRTTPVTAPTRPAAGTLAPRAVPGNGHVN
jgi:oligosaccharide repeat unit polymerase